MLCRLIYCCHLVPRPRLDEWHLLQDRVVPSGCNARCPPRGFALNFASLVLRPLEIGCEPHPFGPYALVRGPCPLIGEVLRSGLSTVCPPTTWERRVAVRSSP